MAEGKLTPFIISILLISMIIAIISLFLAGMNDGYGEEEGMSQEDLAVFNKIDNISATTQEIQDTVGTNVDDNVFDVIGNYFKAGWQSLQLSRKTIDVVAGSDGIIEAAVNQSNLGEGGQIISNTFVTIVVVTIILAVIVSVLLKWQL